jgi:hypothetical protein
MAVPNRCFAVAIAIAFFLGAAVTPFVRMDFVVRKSRFAARVTQLGANKTTEERIDLIERRMGKIEDRIGHFWNSKHFVADYSGTENFGGGSSQTADIAGGYTQQKHGNNSEEWRHTIRDDYKCTPGPIQMIGLRSYAPKDLAADGLVPAACNPHGTAPCCSSTGWCGKTSRHCDNKWGGFDYRLLLHAPANSEEGKIARIIRDPRKRSALYGDIKQAYAFIMNKQWYELSSYFKLQGIPLTNNTYTDRKVYWQVTTMLSKKREANVRKLEKNIPSAVTVKGHSGRDSRTLYFFHKHGIKITSKADTMLYGKIGHWASLLEFFFYVQKAKGEGTASFKWAIFVEDDMLVNSPDMPHNIESFLLAIDSSKAPPLLRFGAGFSESGKCGDGFNAVNAGKVDELLNHVIKNGIYAPSDIMFDGYELSASVCYVWNPVLGAKHGTFPSIIRGEDELTSSSPGKPPGYHSNTKLNVKEYNNAIEACDGLACSYR